MVRSREVTNRIVDYIDVFEYSEHLNLELYLNHINNIIYHLLPHIFQNYNNNQKPSKLSSKKWIATSQQNPTRRSNKKNSTNNQVSIT